MDHTHEQNRRTRCFKAVTCPRVFSADFGVSACMFARESVVDTQWQMIIIKTTAHHLGRAEFLHPERRINALCDRRSAGACRELELPST